MWLFQLAKNKNTNKKSDTIPVIYEKTFIEFRHNGISLVLLYWLGLVNLIQIRVIWEEETLIER